MLIDTETLRAKMLEILNDEQFQEIWEEFGHDMRSGKNVDVEDRAFAIVKFVDLMAYEYFFRVGWKQRKKKPSRFEKESSEVFLKKIEMMRGFILSKWTKND